MRQTANTCLHSSEPGLCCMSLPSDLLTLCLSASAGWLYLYLISSQTSSWETCDGKSKHLACRAHSVVKIDSKVELSPWSPSTTTETSVNTAPSLTAWANTVNFSAEAPPALFLHFFVPAASQANWRRPNKSVLKKVLSWNAYSSGSHPSVPPFHLSHTEAHTNI